MSALGTIETFDWGSSRCLERDRKPTPGGNLPSQLISTVASGQGIELLRRDLAILDEKLREGPTYAFSNVV